MKWELTMKKINRNSVPFLILFLIHSALLGYSFWKTKDRKRLFALLMINVGFAYVLEYIVLNLFRAYIYKPRLLKKPFLDSIFGAILSQAIFVPFTAVFLTERSTGWVGKLLGGFYFFVVEIVFLKLKIFSHSWWKSIYTFLLIPNYFIISDLLYRLLSRFQSVRFLSLFLTYMVAEANILFIMAVKRKFLLGLGRYHSWTEHFIIVPFYAILTSLFAAYSLWRKNTWAAKLMVMAFTIGLNWILKKSKLLKSSVQRAYYLAVRILVIMMYGQIRDWMFRKNPTEVDIVIENLE
jgi:hypothetical protein